MLLLLALSCKKDEPTDVTPIAPSITLITPQPGAFVAAGDVPVAGTAVGLSNVAVNGSPAFAVGSRFDAMIPVERGISRIEVTGRDASGNEWFVRQSILAGDFAEPRGPIEDALLLRLNQQGLDDIAGLLSDLIVASDLLADMSAANPIYNVYDDSVWPLDDTDVDIVLTDLQFEPLRATARTSDENLHLDLRLPSLYVELKTYGTIPLLSNTDGDRIVMSADEVHVEADVQMDVAADGTVTARLTNTQVQMPGFDIYWEYLWDGVDWVLDLFLDLQTMVEGELVGALDAAVPALLGSVFSAFNTSFAMDVFGKTVTLQLRLNEISADPDGIAIGAHLAVEVPSELVRTDGGWLTSPVGGPPSPSRTAPLSLALSDDFLNRMLYEMWAANLIAMTLSTEDGSLDALMLAPLGATSGSIAITAGLPPVVVEKDGKFTAQLGEIGLHLETPGGDNGEYLDVIMSGEAALDLSIEDNEIRLGIGEPDLQFVVADSDWGASNDTVTRLLEDQLPIDVLLLLLGDVTFPLPEIPYLTIDHATAVRDRSHGHTDVEMFLQ